MIQFIYLIFFIVLLISFLCITIMSKPRYATFIEQYGKSFTFQAILSFSLYFMDRFKLMELFPRNAAKIHSQITTLYGAKNGQPYTKIFLAQLITIVYLLLMFFILLAVLNYGDGTILIWGGFIVILFPIIATKDLDKKIKKKKRIMIMELPLFLNKIMLLVNAGETVQKAMIRSLEQKNNAEKHPFYMEFIPLINQLENNYSFHQAMEELSRRCGVQEVSIFTNTVLLNYRRGGNEFVTALRALSHQLWETRKALAKTLGEEASSKLVFPLVMIFVVVMMIVASPAIMLMK